MIGQHFVGADEIKHAKYSSRTPQPLDIGKYLSFFLEFRNPPNAKLQIQHNILQNGVQDDNEKKSHQKHQRNATLIILCLISIVQEGTGINYLN